MSAQSQCASFPNTTSDDRPPNVVHLSDSFQIAYELAEVCHSAGLGAICCTRRALGGTVQAVKEEVRKVLEHAFDDDAKKSAQFETPREQLLEA